MKRIILLIIMTIMTAGIAAAQNEQDALSDAKAVFQSYYDKAKENNQKGYYNSAKALLERCQEMNEKYHGRLCDARMLRRAQEAVERSILKASLKKEAVEQYNKGMQLFRKQEYSEAYKCFEAAGNGGHADAMCMAGYQFEKGLGVSRNPRVAKSWYDKAASLGSQRGREMRNGLINGGNNRL